MIRFEVTTIGADEPVEKQVLDAFRQNSRLHCTGEKFGRTHDFELSVYDMRGRKISLTEHVLHFAGIEWKSGNTYQAVTHAPETTDGLIELTVATPEDTLDISG